MLKKIQRSTLAAQAAGQLERMVVSGDWPEGTRIPPEPRLVEILGVGRNTVREAVRALTHLGLLEARPGDGTYVRSNSLLAASLAHRLEGCSLREIVEARECLERQAARLAARRRSEEDLEGLRKGLAELLAEAERPHPEALVRLAWEQELRLVRASGNALLVELFASIAEPIQNSRLTLIESALAGGIDLERPRRLHRQLVEAIAAEDPEAADLIIVERFRLVRSWLPPEDDNEDAPT